MGGLSTLIINRYWGENKKWSYLTALNGTLTGELKSLSNTLSSIYCFLNAECIFAIAYRNGFHVCWCQYI